LRASVVIPLYQKAPYVQRALISVAEQTIRDIEIIVVDDGSTDGGADIARAFPDPRVRVISQENMGPGAARNRGIAEAGAPVVAFLDADDEWLPTFMETGLSVLSAREDVACVTLGHRDSPPGAGPDWAARGIVAGAHRLEPDTAPGLAIAMLAFMSPCTTLSRTDVLRRHGGFYDRDRCTYAEDAFLYLRILLNEPVAFLPEPPLAIFHRDASGLSNTVRTGRPVEPFLIAPDELRRDCPAPLRELLETILAMRAYKTACVLAFWGDWRKGAALRRAFLRERTWRLPLGFASLVLSSPLGAGLGRTWRALFGEARPPLMG
jgi:glycosyltransferase involved in cell wall biosynthesis